MDGRMPISTGPTRFAKGTGPPPSNPLPIHGALGQEGAMARLILFNKPFGVLSQFTDRGTPGSPRATLSYHIALPGGYPAGRLDRDSEGLLVLTDDGKLQEWISNPRFKKEKSYWVQVEGVPGSAALEALRTGVTLKDGPTRPVRVTAIPGPDIWPRDPPVRYRKSVP